MKFLVKKTNMGLIPLYLSDHESLKKCKLTEGETYEVEIKKKRNYQFHKKYFALVNLCYDNQSIFDNIGDLRNYLTMKAGYYKKVTTDEGEMFLPKSISFSSMDDVEFNELYSNTIDVVIKMLKISEGDLLNEILNYM